MCVKWKEDCYVRCFPENLIKNKSHTLDSLCIDQNAAQATTSWFQVIWHVVLHFPFVLGDTVSHATMAYWDVEMADVKTACEQGN